MNQTLREENVCSLPAPVRRCIIEEILYDSDLVVLSSDRIFWGAICVRRFLSSGDLCPLVEVQKRRDSRRDFGEIMFFDLSRNQGEEGKERCACSLNSNVLHEGESLRFFPERSSERFFAGLVSFPLALEIGFSFIQEKDIPFFTLVHPFYKRTIH